MIKSESGDINITADSVVFDTLGLYNSKEEYSRKRMNLGTAKLENYSLEESLKNISSQINAGDNLNIKTTGDATFVGSKLNIVGDASLQIGGDLEMSSVKDYDYEYKYSKKDRFALENVAGEIGSAVGSAALVVAGAVVSGVSFGTASPVGVGMIASGVSGVVAAGDSASDRDNYRKTTTTTETDYDETIIGTEVKAGNINISVGNDMLESNATRFETSGNLEVNVAGDRIVYEEDEEEHIHTGKQTTKTGKSFGEVVGTGALIGTVIGTGAVLNDKYNLEEVEFIAQDTMSEERAHEYYKKIEEELKNWEVESLSKILEEEGAITDSKKPAPWICDLSPDYCSGRIDSLMTDLDILLWVSGGKITGAITGLVAAQFAKITNRVIVSAVNNALKTNTHLLTRMAQYGFTKNTLIQTLAKGEKFFDPVNKSFVYVSKLSNGKQVGVAVDATTGALKTVMNGKNIIKPRFEIIK